MSKDPVLEPFRSLADLRIDYARELNEQQYAAATAPPGPALIIAGAGSGKTRTLVYRVAYLLEQGIPPERMLLLTFTNKAAAEMMHRVGELLGLELPELWGGTFHSIGHRLLRRHADLLNYPRNFTILDRDDARQLLSHCREEIKLKAGGVELYKTAEFADLLSFSANTERPLSELVEAEGGAAGIIPLLEEWRDLYAERKRAADSMDFDDLLVLWLKLFREHAEMLEQYQRRFQFILVDEYQDTNKIQGELIDLLAARHRNVMVVGDDAQSIYAWRGAHYRNIFDFPERYPKATIYKIETNYRSTPEILALANALMSGGSQRYEKVLVPARKSGDKPVLSVYSDAQQQARAVVQRIFHLHDEGVGLGKIAVLYRSHFHAFELQLELRSAGIPFHLASGIRIFEQAHMKDVVAYLRWLLNPRDEVSFKRLVLMLHGIGAKSADKLWEAFNARPRQELPIPAPLATALQGLSGLVPKKSSTAWAQFTTTISQLEDPAVRNEPSQLIGLVRDAGYDDYLQQAFANFRSRQDDLQKLSEYSLKFDTLEEFLTELALLTHIEAEAEQASDSRADQLLLSTVHQAKGLEFDAVFVIMLADGLFPSHRSLPDSDEIEEERRLLYVAITRARDHLFLSYPLLRVTANQIETLQASSFLEGVPPQLLEQKDCSFGAASDF